MEPEQKAIRYHDAGCNCAQAVFATFADQFGITEPQALKLAASFGGGMGRSGEVCGAVTGALIVLGLNYGASTPTDRESKLLAYRKASEFMEEFRRRQGEIHCRALLGMDISTEEGWQQARETNRFNIVCTPLIESAVTILQEMI
ncbi:MAG: C-GCAxxG-C-C family protein [Anaerolineaceae bacterium]|jgi:C_GCAxxG_C_C family probable redox protein